MRLCQPHDSGHGFGELIQVFFVFFLIDFFFNLTVQYLIDSELNFMIYFNFFIQLSQSHD